MKVVLVLLLATVVACLAKPQDQYTTKYDNIDVEGIIGNDRLLNTYLHCLLDEGRCNPEGNTLKQIIPDALQTGCSKCNPRQQEAARKIIRHLVDNRPDDWNALLDKYDPSRQYEANYRPLLDQ